ncbi:serine hydrolase domain-containing protein [Microbispora bryophytorum]|uniref:serine hydrolase domain-containing protein n=1 Tax=Microbispora bryophytorum TaxID=1460882 RepID=UPI0033C8B1C4
MDRMNSAHNAVLEKGVKDIVGASPEQKIVALHRLFPVRWLLTHQAGLPALDHPVTPAEASAWDPMVTALAAQRPFWEPGTDHGYHAHTYGWLVGEVVRRVTGRSIGRFLTEEIAAPLGLDLWIGLPQSERHRVSRIVSAPIDLGALAGIDLDALPEPARGDAGLRRSHVADDAGDDRRHAVAELRRPRRATRRDAVHQWHLHRPRAGPLLRCEHGVDREALARRVVFLSALPARVRDARAGPRPL